VSDDPPVTGDKRGLRSYEVHQRERPGEATPLISPGELRRTANLTDPYRLLTILREHYPCYRDWSGNSYWITRYDDVTSVLHDEANYATPTKASRYARTAGRDLGAELPVVAAHTAAVDATAPQLATAIVERVTDAGECELSGDVAMPFAIGLVAATLALPPDDVAWFAQRYSAMHRGVHSDPVAEQAGRRAMDELTAYVGPLLDARRAEPGDDVLSAIAGLDLEEGPATADDVVTTLLEADHETLPGALTNLWFLLLTHPGQLDEVLAERRLVKAAYLEALRHSTPVLNAARIARHEVERFGRLLPEGALVVCSAAAANRDPRVFDQPEEFIVQRKDLCQREPRGQYRADGLCSGLAPALGTPSVHPAVPEDRPRSLYALTRDTVVQLSQTLLDVAPKLRLAPGATPVLRSLRLGEAHTCWDLPVTLR
jgi:cytochrome P450